MVTVSLDSPSCEVTLFDPVSVVYRDVTRQDKGLYRLKYVGALWSGLAYLSRYNSVWYCHTEVSDTLAPNPTQEGKPQCIPQYFNLLQFHYYIIYLALRLGVEMKP
jgi:hypothetical protein